METGFQRLFLALLLALPALCWAQASEDGELGKIISPDVQRNPIKEADLDSENFEFGVFVGLLNIDDFGSNAVTGITLAYHITENLFLEGAYAVSEAEKTSYERLSGGVALLTEEERELTYYNLALGYNFFPGQIYLARRWTFNSNFYLLVGAGNTKFAAKEYFTYHLGGGLRFYSTDWLALDMSLRNHVFSHEIFGESKTANNMETRLGVSVFF